MKPLIFSFLLLSFLSLPALAAQPQHAIFAGGCFWCMEPPFDKVKGVLKTVSGYTGGKASDPSYDQVSTGTTGHYEAVKVTYDPAKVSYQQLLNVFWKNIDPYDDTGQFCDKGQQYLSAIFYLDDAQKKAAMESKMSFPQVKNFKTLILGAKTFYPAEEHHQDYYQKNPIRYKFYRHSCGRDQRLEKIWKE